MIYYYLAESLVSWFDPCSVSPRICCGDANKNNFIHDIRAKNGAMMNIIDATNDELADARELLDVADVLN